MFPYPQAYPMMRQPQVNAPQNSPVVQEFRSLVNGMSMSIGFLYGSFNIAFIFKELASLGFSLLKNLTFGTAKAFSFTFKIIFKPIQWTFALTDPYKQPNKLLIFLALLVLLWLWIKRLKSAAVKHKQVNK